MNKETNTATPAFPASASEGSGLTRTQKRWIGAAVGGIVLFGLPLVYHDVFILHILTLVFFYSIGASSLHLIIRTGHISFGHAAFMGIGGYTCILLVIKAGWPLPLAVIGGVLAAAVVAALIAAPLLRLTGKYFVLVTFLFGEILRMVAVEWISMTGGSEGLFELQKYAPVFRSHTAVYYIALGAAVLGVGICLRILRSEFGRAMDAMREGVQIAECSGVPVVRFKMMTFVIACGLIAFQGGLMTFFIGFISPLSFSMFESLNLVVMNVMGCLTNLAGALIGTVFLIALPELLRDWVELQQIFYGIILIVVMAFLPGGMIEIGVRMRKALVQLWRGGQP